MGCDVKLLERWISKQEEYGGWMDEIRRLGCDERVRLSFDCGQDKGHDNKRRRKHIPKIDIIISGKNARCDGCSSGKRYWLEIRVVGGSSNKSKGHSLKQDNKIIDICIL